MNPLHTPIKIDFLLSIYCGSFRRNNFPQHTSPISETILQGLLDDRLVMTFGADYTLTIKGEQFVERLLNTPLEPPPSTQTSEPSSKPVLSPRATFDDFYGRLRDASKTVGRVSELHLLRAVQELGLVVERIARAQKQEDR